MGDVIEFRPLGVSARKHRNADGGVGECQILFFTGVRYERHAEPETDIETPRRTGTKPRVGPKRGKKRA